MQTPLFRAICQMGIFVICAQTIIHFRPNGSYEKYFRLLVSVMVLLQVFLPVTELFAGKSGRSMEADMQYLEEKLEESMEEAAASALQAEQLLKQMTLQEVEQRVAMEELQKEDETAGTVQIKSVGKIAVNIGTE